MNLFKNITLLMIVVVDICYWLHPVVNPRMRSGGGGGVLN